MARSAIQGVTQSHPLNINGALYTKIGVTKATQTKIFIRCV